MVIFNFYINDTPEIRKTFKAFDVQEVRSQYTISKDGPAKDVMELVVWG